MFFNKQVQKEQNLKSKAKTRREKKKQTITSDAPEEEDEVVEDEEGALSLLIKRPFSRQRWCIQVSIAGSNFTFLLDSGATVSVLSYNTWKKLPSEFRDSVAHRKMVRTRI